MTELRVVVADDEADMREYFATMLPHLGYAVVAVAATGRELIEACRRLAPDIVVTDLKMPDVEGTEAMREIRTFSQAPILVVTGYQDREHRENARAAGADGFLLKPIKRDALDAALQAISRRSAREDPER